MHHEILDVIYVNFNSTDLLLDSLTSLRNQAGSSGIAVRTHVVDNRSRPDAAAALDRLPGDVDLIRADRNLGFGAACNLGARKGRAPLLFFLNPDTLVLPETLPGLLEVLRRHDGEVLAGPRQFADLERRFTIAPMRGTTLWGDVADTLHDRGWLPKLTLSCLHQRMAVLARQAPVPVREVPGNALAVGRRTFERLGGFDTRYFLYHEDSDLCLRARALGLPCLYLPGTGMVHWLERSTDTERPLAEASIQRGHDDFLKSHYNPSARRLTALAMGVVKRLPCLGRRADRAADMNPDRPLSLPPASAGCRRVVEIARSTLFDNCLTAIPEGDAFSLPTGLHARLFPGEYFLRVAAESRPGRWREHSLHRLVKKSPAEPIPPFTRQRMELGS